MKIVLIVLFVILIGAAVFLGPWLFLPIAAGVLTAWAILIGTPCGKFAKLLRVVQISAVCVAVMIAVGLVINTPWAPQPVRTSFASKANSFLARLMGPSRGTVRLSLATIEVDRLSLRNALQMERRKVTLISKALALYQVAGMEYEAQASSGNPDERLSAAIKEFHSIFEKERLDPDGKTIRLLKPEDLEVHLERASAAIDKLEIDGLSNATDSQTLRRFKSGIPNALNNFQLEPLYLVVTTLQDRLKTSLRVQLSPDPTYEVKYDRDTNSVISQQRTRINLSDNPASEVDLTGFFTSQNGQLSTNLYEEVLVKEDSSPEKIMEPKTPAYSLRPGVKELVITKRIIRRNAAEGIVGGSLPLQFVQVRVDWPLPPKHAITLALQERGNPNTTWPFVVPIDNKDDASLNRILMPRYAVYFVEPTMDVKPTASNDELTPSVSAGKLRDLVPDSAQVIRVELLPRYLSNSGGQKIKEYLVIENMIAAVIISLISGAGLFGLKASWSGGSGKPD
jgi:hypothetical protein